MHLSNKLDLYKYELIIDTVKLKLRFKINDFIKIQTLMKFKKTKQLGHKIN